jgi:hypothetical protein
MAALAWILFGAAPRRAASALSVLSKTAPLSVGVVLSYRPPAGCLKLTTTHSGRFQSYSTTRLLAGKGVEKKVPAPDVAAPVVAAANDAATSENNDKKKKNKGSSKKKSSTNGDDSTAATAVVAEAEVAPSSFSSSSSSPIVTRNLVKFKESGGASSFQGWSNVDVIVRGEGTIKNNDMPFVNRHEELWDLFLVNARNAQMCATVRELPPKDFRLFELLFCVQVCWFASPMFSHRA